MELLGVGAAEAFLVLIVTLLVVGPHRFPQIARDGGRWYKVARKYAAEVMGDVRGALDEIEQEMSAEGDELREVMSLSEEVQRDLTTDLRAVEADTTRLARETGAELREAGEAASAPLTTPAPAAGAQPAGTSGGASNPSGQRVTVAQLPRPAGVTGTPTGRTTPGGDPATGSGARPADGGDATDTPPADEG